jgi:hypothetical protein
VSAWQAELNVRAYQLNADGAADETEGDVTSCQIWMLPATVRDHFALVVHASFPPECFLMRPSFSLGWRNGLQIVKVAGRK